MRFQVLGPLRVWAGSAWSPIQAAQQRVVLAVLLAEAGRVVSTEQLIDEIWGERPPRSAITIVQTYVMRLRRLLGDDAGPVLVTRGRGYELAVTDDEVDAAAFRGLAAASRQAAVAGDSGAALARLDEGLALWRGPALADVPASPGVTAYATRLNQSKLDAVELRLDVLLELGNHAEVAVEVRGLVDEHPFRERLWGQLMMALYRGGRRAEALDTYRQARQVLTTELGIEPGEELRQLQQAVLAGAPVPSGTGRRRTGAGAVPPAQLPAEAAGFTGREAQLKQLDTLLPGEGGQHPVVVVSTITGTAGVGKTALAVRWAHRIRERFPDGQLYVNLRGYADGPPLRPVEALARFLAGLGVPNEEIPVEQDQAAGLYRTLVSGRRVLLLLDNAHHPDQVRPLLPGSAGCLAVVTSRDRLGGLVAHDGAARLDLDTLTPDEAQALLARLLGPERVAAEPEAAAELARRCGFLPLAMRIAAANLGGRATIGDYVSRLRNDRLVALEVAGDPAAGVRAAFDHSYGSLPEPAQRLFRLLGTLPGPDLTVPAAAAMAGTSVADASRLLELLASGHLVEAYARDRYSLHDLLRHYARERADAQSTERERSDARCRLYGFYLRGVDAAASCLYPEMLRLPVPAELTAGPAVPLDGHPAALAWLGAELPNLAAAVDSALRHGPAWAAWRLADALRGYLMLHRHELEWQDVARAGLAAAEVDGDDRGIAAAHLSLAGLHWVAARYEPAVEHYTRSLALTRRAGWAEGEAATLGNLGLVHWTSGHPLQAAEHLAAALAVDKRTGRLAGRATNLTNLGLVYGALGRLSLAAERQREALDGFRQIGSRSGEQAALAGLGETYHELGRLDDALATLTQALALAREIGEPLAEAETVRFLARVHRDQGRHAQARELAGTAVRLAREVGDTRAEAEALVVQASTGSQGAPEDAVAGCRCALELARRDGYRRAEATALIGLATALLCAGQPDPAEHATAAATIARERGFRLIEGDARTVLATIELRRGRLGQALDHAAEALAIHTETGHRPGQARTHLVTAAALRAGDRTGDAQTHLDRATAIATETGMDLAYEE